MPDGELQRGAVELRLGRGARALDCELRLWIAELRHWVAISGSGLRAPAVDGRAPAPSYDLAHGTAKPW
eukprot:8131957-Alexandrium_andersonii.AAC.1